MRLILLLPNIIFIIISGYNLWNEFTIGNPGDIAYKVLHATVLVSSVSFSALIIRSLYKSFLRKTQGNELVLENVVA